MKNIFLLLAGILLISCVKQPEPKTDISSKDYLVMSVLWYQRSAEMQALYHQGFNLAKMQLEKHLENYKGDKKPAVVVDIDETMLNNSPFEGKVIETGVGYTSDSWKNWTSKASAKALPGAVDFANFAKNKGVDIFYISNRKVSELDVTRKNLEKEGFPNASNEFIFLRKETGSKKARREKVNETHEIFLLIGDNLGDFSEIFENRGNDFGFSIVNENKNMFGDKFIVLPNPMYGAWEKPLYNGAKNLTEEEKYKKRKEEIISY